MSDFKTIAHPYAQAAFDFANSKQALTEWQSMLTLLADVIDDPQISPHVMQLSVVGGGEPQHVLDMLSAICEGLIDEFAQNLLKIMAESQRLIVMRDVLNAFNELKNEHDQIIEAVVTSSEPLTSEMVNELTVALTHKLQRKVTLSSVIDNTLVGGIIVKAGELVIDGSVRSAIDRLSARLHK